jgi:hypothetical protein
MIPLIPSRCLVASFHRKGGCNDGVEKGVQKSGTWIHREVRMSVIAYRR